MFQSLFEKRNKVNRAKQIISAQWDSIVTKEPISDDLKELVRADLRNAWYFRRHAVFRMYLRLPWATWDSYEILLQDTVGHVAPKQLHHFCNKPTAFYYLQSAQSIDCYGERTLKPGTIFTVICGEWFRPGKTEPSIEFGHFFATPIRITSTGPSTVREIVDAHLSLCEQASDLLENQANNKNNEADQDVINTRIPSELLKHYSILPLYRAIVVMLDNYGSFPEENFPPDPDGYFNPRKYAQIQDVLIARTGVEEGLSAPISFDSLRSSRLPLQRYDDITMPNVGVVRVTLAVAIEFIAGLEAREELAFPKLKNELSQDKWLNPSPPTESEGGDHEVCRCSPEAWADAHIEAAEKHGYDSIYETRQSIRRVQARMVGQEYYELKHYPSQNRWKY